MTVIHIVIHNKVYGNKIRWVRKWVRVDEFP